LKKIVEIYHNQKKNKTALRYFKKLYSLHPNAGEDESIFMEIFDEDFIKVIVDIAQDYELDGQFMIPESDFFYLRDLQYQRK